ncbi:GPI anchor biosynthetic process [Nesidiocoris tenuis]|uniref:Phosphatidylinositol-glycan biosynthesis class W protein n=1 Tax=Nesidiocoris tenuis TaxID=355587 RepID=A0ABN7AH02_9HEMI|nr:GPI anchor biosynthetic process [Nesidiocoris tenuis]
MEDPSSYRKFHEKYLTNLQGSSVFEILCLLGTVLMVGFLSLYLRIRFKVDSPSSTFIVDVLTFICPCIALLTIFNGQVLLWFCILAAGSIMIVINELFINHSKVSVSSAMESKVVVKKRSFITNFKSVISLLTVICILAVDFTVFPLRHAKTETYGYSLMDTGVGFFIVSNGLTFNTRRIENLVKKSLVANVPLLILGLIRYASVEKIYYQKHATEYGVHWNFFFTLAFVKFLGAVLIAKMPRHSLTLASTILAVHHAVLETGVGDWVISDAPRSDLLSANREGIVSIPGYLSLYLASVGLGKWLVFSNGHSSCLKDELFKGLILLTGGATSLSVLVAYDNVYLPSRRLANLTFVLWISTLCLLVIGIILIWEIVIILISRRREVNIFPGETVLTLEAISANNLLFFLVGNVLTGAVNMAVHTLLVTSTLSLLIILAYTVTTCAIVTYLYLKRLTLKFW